MSQPRRSPIAPAARTPLLPCLIVIALASACGGGPTRPGPQVETLRISCPADVSARSNSGSGQPVEFQAPPTTGGAAPVTATCTPASGSLFNLGTTPVSCRATDATTQTATCAFSVTMTGPTLAVTKYLAFGDSVTEGQNGTNSFGVAIIDTPNSYPTQLQALFDVSYPGQGIVVANEGRGGEWIEDANVRLPRVLAVVRPGAVLLIDGYNNLLNQCGFDAGVTSACETTIEFVVGKLREAVRIARTSPDVGYVFVGTLTPPGPLNGILNDRRIAPNAITRTNAGIRQMMPREGALVVDLHPLFLGHEREYITGDGLHLLPAGNQVLAEAFFQAVGNTVPRTAPGLDPDRR